VDNPSDDDRSSIGRAIGLGNTLITISLEMALPGAIGYWIDQRLGTKVVFLILGLILGITTGMWHLIKLTK
jgi:F0F1-type ATP synthase assembly protein I